MMHNNRNQYYTHNQQRYTAEYSEAVRIYREKTVVKIMPVKETLAEEMWNYPGFIVKINVWERLWNDIPPLSIGIVSEECINCGTLSFFTDHSKAKHN